MGRVLVTGRLPAGSLDALAGHELLGPGAAGSQPLDPAVDGSDRRFTPAALAAAAADVDGIVCVLPDRIDAAVLASPRLRVVALTSVGYDHVDVATAHERGIVVTHTPGVLDDTTADLAMLLVLLARRDASTAEADLRAGRWVGFGFEDRLGHDVHGAMIGLVGYGRIGRCVARRAEGFGMTVLHHTRHDTGVPGWTADLHELLARSDVVSLHVPLTPATHHLIGATELALLPPHAVLVNTARGAVVDEAALADALHTGRLGGAGLDVFEHEPEVHPALLRAPRTSLLPHIGSATVATRTAMARMAAASVAAVLAGRPPDHPVPAP